MAINIDEILALPAESRAELAHVICDSLEGDPNSDLSPEQISVLKRFLDDFLANPRKTTPWDEVRAEVFLKA